MKKTVKIHISGYIFTIEEDAYDKLEDWLKKISTQFSDEEGGQEIIEDIEFRVAELLNDSAIGEEKIITLNEINKVITTMGMPEDFAEETRETTQTSQATEQKSKFDKKIKKRLYRDYDNSLLGGVCGGLGAYFSIDPVIIRVLFVLAFFFGGFGPLVYIILWIITPAAKTSSQKLEMKGERVSVSNIERTIKEEFENVKKNIINQSKSENYRHISNTVQNILNLIFAIIKVGFKVLLYFIAGVFIFTGFVVIISLFAFLFFQSAPDFITGNQNISDINLALNIVPMQMSSFLAQFGLILLIGIPFASILYIGVKMIFKFKTNNKIIGLTATGLWVVGIILSLGTGLSIASNYKADSKQIKTFILKETQSDTLYLDIFNETDDDYISSEINAGNFSIYNSKNKVKLFGEPNFNIKKSDDNNIKLKINYYSRGKTKKQSSRNLGNIDYNWIQKDSLIQFSPYFTLKAPQKIFGQEIKMTLYLPEGKTVYIKDGMSDIIYDIENVQNMWDGNMTDKFWIMTEEGLSVTSEGNEEGEGI